MNPFIVLVGAVYYPGGWSDYAGDAETVEEAKALALKKVQEHSSSPQYCWWEVVYLETKEIVARSDNAP